MCKLTPITYARKQGLEGLTSSDPDRPKIAMLIKNELFPLNYFPQFHSDNCYFIWTNVMMLEFWFQVASVADIINYILKDYNQIISVCV